MLNNKHTFCGKAVVASLTLLSASVTAAVNNGPVKVTEPASSSQAGQLQNVLSQKLSLVQDEQRYIVKFKQTGSAAMKGKNKLKKGPNENASDRAFDAMAAKSILKNAGAKPHKVLGKHKMVAASMSKSVLNKLRKNPNIEEIAKKQNVVINKEQGG